MYFTNFKTQSNNFKIKSNIWYESLKIYQWSKMSCYETERLFCIPRRGLKMARRSSPSLGSNLKFTCWIVKAASKIHISFLDTPVYLKDDCKTSIMKVYRKTTHTDQYLHLTYGNTTANTNVVWFAPWCTERRLLLPMIQTIKKIISHVLKIYPLCKRGDTRWIFQPPRLKEKKKQNLSLVPVKQSTSLCTFAINERSIRNITVDL